MSFWFHKSKRFERVAALELPPGQWERAWAGLRRRDVLGRIALALAAAAIVCAVIRGWDPPFAYRVGYVPQRDVTATVAFTKPDPVATAANRDKARGQSRFVFAQDAEPLTQLRAELRNALVQLTAAETLDKLEPRIWQSFQPPPAKDAPQLTAKQREEEFQKFRAAFTPQAALDAMEKALAEVFAPFEERGLLDKLPTGPGNQDEILVYPEGHPKSPQVVRVGDVLIGDGTMLREALQKNSRLAPVADRLFQWLQPRLKATLSIDAKLTGQYMDDAERNVPEVQIEYSAGQTLAKAGEPLYEEQINLLDLEYKAAIAWRHAEQWGKMLARAAAVTGLVFAGMLLCGVYMRFRQRGPLASLTQLIVLLLMAIAAVAVARWAAIDPWRGEVVPVLLFGMITAIVYSRELALLLSGVLAVIVVWAVGGGLQEWLVLAGAVATAVLNQGRIRSREKLIYVGLFAGLAAMLLRVGLGLIDDQPLSWGLLRGAAFGGFWVFVGAGFIMSGLLPFVERLFGVMTDLSLLQLGDMAHPLLQELVRRAPSTYNHSVTVGTIAEAAAESIGARGLLVRVGAYFHDIGKMLKPDYFAENQGSDESRHETLAPAMSTLVIVAHIKDGADLARQHRLPQPIIDLIVQHHGTTRVEYFYDRAAEQQQADPNGGPVDENTYRYPGPKPQTKEAAVLMLADAVESASRTLVEPTPARIENLVRQLAEKRLHAGQFDESGLTLRELRTIDKSMTVSLTSIYHGRIKYPDQRS